MDKLYSAFQILVFLVTSHFLFDVILQSEKVSENKKSTNKRPRGYDPDKDGILLTTWPYFLTAHALVHGLGVFYVTQSFLFLCIEVVSHWVIDYCKGRHLFNIHTDQALHLSFKILYVILMYNGIGR